MSAEIRDSLDAASAQLDVVGGTLMQARALQDRLAQAEQALALARAEIAVARNAAEGGSHG